MGLKEVSLTFGIAILFALLVGFTIDAFYEHPEYNNFCEDKFFEAKPFVDSKIQGNCTFDYNTELEKNCIREGGDIRYNYDKQSCKIMEGCDFCRASYEDANKDYNLNILWITAIIGLIAIFIGMYAPLYYDPIASGFIFGGVLTLIYGTVRSFSELSKIARVIILAVEFTLLIWLGIKKVLKKPNESKKTKKVVKTVKKRKK